MSARNGEALVQPLSIEDNRSEPLEIPPPPRWYLAAKCWGEDSNLFFSDDQGAVEGSRKTQEAKAICADCRVIQQCFDYAMDNNIAEGVWGGKSERQRLQIRRARKKARRALEQTTLE